MEFKITTVDHKALQEKSGLQLLLMRIRDEKLDPIIDAELDRRAAEKKKKKRLNTQNN